MNAILEVNNIIKKYKKFTLDKVSFTLEKGTITGFIGENGSGKSTTIKAIGGLINLDEGEIKIYDKDYKSLTILEKQDIAIVLDELCFPEKMKVKKLSNILKDLFPKFNAEIFKNLLNRFLILEDKKISELSKGMKAKLNFAIALSHDAKLLILDEPTNGLDPVARDEFLDILEDFVYNNKGTVLISSHIISDLEKISDNFIFIHGGKILLNSSKEDILKNYFVVKYDKEIIDEDLKQYIYKFKKNHNGYELLVNKDFPYLDNSNQTNIEEIFIMFIRGNNLW